MVDREVRKWAQAEAARRAGLLRLGYFGSYARGDWGVGSDLDLVVVVRETSEPFERRALSFDLTALPIAADLLVYTEEEWRRMRTGGKRFIQTLERETVWVYPIEPDPSPS